MKVIKKLSLLKKQNMLIKKILVPFLISCTLFISCEEQNSTSIFDNEGRENFDQINAFVYFGLNGSYLYKDEQPLFQEPFDETLDISPRDYFELLTIQEDRFSFIVDDFEVLENNFAGISLSDGIDYSFITIDQDNNDVIAYVNYVANDSPGEASGIKRGDLISTINGTQLTIQNRFSLTGLSSYTAQLVSFDTDTEEFIERNNIDVIKEEFTEDPILINKVIDYEGLKVGYIMYNQFVSGSENELNTVFAEFAAAGIDDLILDLRYNGGGRVSTAVDLCGLVTGQFNDQVVISEQWNSELQATLQASNPEFLVSRFRNTLTDGETSLNSLNLTRLSIISSKNRTASSSELVINGLSSYIDIIHIGDELGTVGKSQASITVFDSEDFTKENINPNHKYALQPLVYTSANRDGIVISNEGITPNVFINEDFLNLGVLGETSDPLLQTALNEITGTTVLAAKNQSKSKFGTYLGNSKEHSLDYQRMYE